jgi:hypothetical protein
VQSLARLTARTTARAIDVSIALVTLPAKWAADGLRSYADQGNEPSGGAAAEQDGAADAREDAAA